MQLDVQADVPLDAQRNYLFECATQETRRRDELSESTIQRLKSQLRRQSNALFLCFDWVGEKPKLDNAQKCANVVGSATGIRYVVQVAQRHSVHENRSALSSPKVENAMGMYR